MPARLPLAIESLRLERNGAIRLAFSVPMAGSVRCVILDVAGRRVLDRDLGAFEAGHQLARVADARLSPGVYVATIAQGGRRASEKAVIVR